MKKVKKAAARKPATKKTAARKAPARKAAPRKKAVKPIPAGYHALTPYLCVNGAGAAIDFYKKVFGARERLRMGAPGGKVGHAELTIADSVVMIADEFPDMGFFGPKEGVGLPVNMHLYVKDVDAVFQRAIAEGAKVMRAIENKFYGDRTGSITDPFGHVWHLATHVEDLTPAEMKRRGEAQGGASG
jgi:PhnB protein